MQIRQDDTYRAECRDGVSAEALSILTNLYQPLTGCESIALYLTLVSEASGINGPEKLRKLLHLTGLQIDQFAAALSRLEEYGLLRTWCRESGDHVSYIYELIRVPSAQEFIGRSALISKYLSVMGKEETEAALARFGAVALSKAGYMDITRPVAEEGNVLKKAPVFTENAVQPSLIRGDALWPLFTKFIGMTSTLLFPAELRTPDHLNLICRLASVNGLSAETMREILSRCVDMNTMSLNTEKLKVMAARAKPQPVTSDDPYMLPPAAFLESKQQGTPVTGTDRSILQYLAADMHFPDEVINVMVEYVLKVSSNRLNRKFVESVAGEWARDGVRTREQAFAQTKKGMERAQKARIHAKVDTPEYFRMQKEGKLPEEHEANAELIAKIREKQKKMGG